MMESIGMQGVAGRLSDLYKGPAKIQVTEDAAGGFMDLMKTAIDKANRLQAEADESIVSLAKGSGASIHETMIAMEKAEVNFQLLMELRNKVISAYEEIMRMNI